MHCMQQTVLSVQYSAGAAEPVFSVHCVECAQSGCMSSIQCSAEPMCFVCTVLSVSILLRKGK